MHTLKVKAHIAPDGVLRLEVPTGLSAGDVDVVLVVQPVPATAAPSASPPAPLPRPTGAPKVRRGEKDSAE